MKSDVFFAYMCVREVYKNIKNEVDANPTYCVSLPGYTWQCGLKYTDNKLQTLQDKEMMFLLENIIGGGISSVIGDRTVKSHENKRILYFDAINSYGSAMSGSLPYDESEM